MSHQPLPLAPQPVANLGALRRPTGPRGLAGAPRPGMRMGMMGESPTGAGPFGLGVAAGPSFAGPFCGTGGAGGAGPFGVTDGPGFAGPFGSASTRPAIRGQRVDTAIQKIENS